MPPTNEPYQLTEHDLLTLRARMARIGFISDGVTGVLSQAPWFTYILATHEYALHSDGATVAVTDRDDVACALLRNERIEQGYCRRILSPHTDVQEALKSPEARAELSRRRADEAARQRFAERLAREQEDEARTRRNNALKRVDPTTISLDDLFTP